jgi:ABC-type nickel/cobalt efflux system permease component RcnA
MMSNLGIFSFIPIITILSYLLILGLSIYFIVRTIKFMNDKTKLDQQRNEKLDSLLKAIQENKRPIN